MRTDTLTLTGFSAGTDEHDTPRDLVAPIEDAMDGFDLDPSASATSRIGTVNWTLCRAPAPEGRRPATLQPPGLPNDGGDVALCTDGLRHPWHGDVWLNPPYSEVGDWMEKARREVERGNADRVVALVFARTSTRWYHDHATTADYEWRKEGRVTFAGSDNSAPSPSIILIWGEPPTALLRWMNRHGHVVEQTPAGGTA